MNSITLGQYFGTYIAHPDISALVRACASDLLRTVNSLLEVAEQDGVVFEANPVTGSLISGRLNGGFRPQDCKVGAFNSTHKKGQGIDIFDPDRQFASWCLASIDELKNRGLHIEDPRWTPTWVHIQIVPPRSLKTVYVPSMEPPIAALPQEWKEA
jgi:hypothetical protein